MSVTLPYPDKPANGQTPDATPILANLMALLAAINSFDGAGINAKTVTEPALADQVNPRMRDAGSIADFIETGGWTASFVGLGWTMPSGICWYNGYRNNFSGSGYSVAINTDTYYSVSQTGAVNAPQPVPNNSAIPVLPANSQWLAKVIAGASAITSIVDMRNMSPLAAGPLMVQSTNAGSGGGTMTGLNVGGFKIMMGRTAFVSIAGSQQITVAVTWPLLFFTQAPILVPSLTQEAIEPKLRVANNAIPTANGASLELATTTGVNGPAGAGGYIDFIAMGV